MKTRLLLIIYSLISIGYFPSVKAMDSSSDDEMMHASEPIDVYPDSAFIEAAKNNDTSLLLEMLNNASIPLKALNQALVIMVHKGNDTIIQSILQKDTDADCKYLSIDTLFYCHMLALYLEEKQPTRKIISNLINDLSHPYFELHYRNFLTLAASLGDLEGVEIILDSMAQGDYDENIISAAYLIAYASEFESGICSAISKRINVNINDFDLLGKWLLEACQYEYCVPGRLAVLIDFMITDKEVHKDSALVALVTYLNMFEGNITGGLIDDEPLRRLLNDRQVRDLLSYLKLFDNKTKQLEYEIASHKFNFSNASRILAGILR